MAVGLAVGMVVVPAVDAATVGDKDASLVKAPSLTLSNTQGGLTRVKWPRKKVVFLTMGDRAAQKMTQAWAQPIHEKYGDHLEYVPIAMLKAVPSAMKLAAETMIKTQYKEVLMDWSGVAAERYMARPGLANVYLIGKDGTMLAEYHTEVSDAKLAEVDALIAAAESDNK